MNAVVTRVHREAALSLLYTNPVASEVKWLDTGAEPEDRHGGITRAKSVAQALADIEAATEARVRAELAGAWEAGVEFALEACGEVGPCGPAVDDLYAQNPYRAVATKEEPTDGK